MLLLVTINWSIYVCASRENLTRIYNFRELHYFIINILLTLILVELKQSQIYKTLNLKFKILIN